MGHIKERESMENITAEQLSAFSLFSGLAEAELSQIAAMLDAPTVYQKGELVYSACSFRRAVGLILCGSVTVMSAEGEHPTLMNRLSCGAMFGAAALFGAQEMYVTQITADTTTQILFVSQEQMSSFLRQYPLIAENYICFLSGRIRFLNRKLSVLTAGSAAGRLYQYFLTHRNENGSVTLPCSMVELADVLNIGRSSLYRARDALIAAGFVRQVGKIYYITG